MRKEPTMRRGRVTTTKATGVTVDDARIPGVSWFTNPVPPFGPARAGPWPQNTRFAPVILSTTLPMPKVVKSGPGYQLIYQDDELVRRSEEEPDDERVGRDRGERRNFWGELRPSVRVRGRALSEFAVADGEGDAHHLRLVR